jgi:hypothetical protein
MLGDDGYSVLALLDSHRGLALVASASVTVSGWCAVFRVALKLCHVELLNSSAIPRGGDSRRRGLYFSWVGLPVSCGGVHGAGDAVAFGAVASAVCGGLVREFVGSASVQRDQVIHREGQRVEPTCVVVDGLVAEVAVGFASGYHTPVFVSECGVAARTHVTLGLG